MFRDFDDLVKETMSQEAIQISEEIGKQLLLEMKLNEIRKKKNITQEDLAEKLNINQAALSRLERRSDMHVSKLKSLIEAMGGKLEIIAQFPDEEIKINQFLECPNC